MIVERKTMRIASLLALVGLLLVASCSVAQPGNLSSSSKKAIKKFEEAQTFYDRRQNQEALESCDAAIKADPNFIEAHVMKAYVQSDMRDREGAKASFRKAIAINPTYFPNSYYSLGDLELRDGNYEPAAKAFEEFLRFRSANAQLQAKAKNALETCEFGIFAKQNPVPFEPKNLGDGVNTAAPEYFPDITADGETLLYTRVIKDSRAADGIQEDFFVSQKPQGAKKWGKSRNLGAPINTYFNEGAPTLSADGGTLIFTACEIFGEYGPGRKGLGSCDLFYTIKVGNRWSPPVNIGSRVNSNHWETQPSFSADGQTIYFIRGIRGNDGRPKNGDIYRTQLNEQGYWEKPEKMSSIINTPGHEASVLIHPDGQTLYFSSDGHTGMGGLDIFMSRMQPNGEWGKPLNLGYPINTHSDENSLLVSADGQLAFFASDREGGFGDLDLYSFELPAALRPKPVTYMKGKVFDRVTKKPLEAKFELIDLETGKTMVQSYSNSGNGDFLVSLPINKNYALNVSVPGYMFYSDNFELKHGTLTDPFLKNVPMGKIEVADDESKGIVIGERIFWCRQIRLETRIQDWIGQDGSFHEKEQHH